MSFNKVKCVTVTCDLCDADFEPGDYLVHYDNEGEAREMLDDCGWGWDASNVWCADCHAHCTCGCLFLFHKMEEGTCEACEDCEGWRLYKNWS